VTSDGGGKTQEGGYFLSAALSWRELEESLLEVSVLEVVSLLEASVLPSLLFSEVEAVAEPFPFAVAEAPPDGFLA
jgi:hypothetical protein